MTHNVKPQLAAIEKKSTGVTLTSSLKNIQGLRILEIDRNVSSGSKITRFLEMQPYIASKRISLPISGVHTNNCITHCSKITANDTHRHDDIADTLYDGVKLALIDKIIAPSLAIQDNARSNISKSILNNFNNFNRIRGERTWQI